MSHPVQDHFHCEPNPARRLDLQWPWQHSIPVVICRQAMEAPTSSCGRDGRAELLKSFRACTITTTSNNKFTKTYAQFELVSIPIESVYDCIAEQVAVPWPEDYSSMVESHFNESRSSKDFNPASTHWENKMSMKIFNRKNEEALIRLPTSMVLSGMPHQAHKAKSHVASPHPRPHRLSLAKSTITRLSSDYLSRRSVGSQSPAMANSRRPQFDWVSNGINHRHFSICQESQSSGMATTVQSTTLCPSLTTLSCGASSHQTPVTLSPLSTPNSGNGFNNSINGSISSFNSNSRATARQCPCRQHVQSFGQLTNPLSLHRSAIWQHNGAFNRLSPPATRPTSEHYPTPTLSITPQLGSITMLFFSWPPLELI
eukprot:Gb_21715 [translate_table: standard]